mmetsp:Transcript_65342/g.181701  ORF Transcript_65342/g.181701 Transcript_65342/m.181701 type:complete len:378 (+) Transcript_65342:865-1998(+)
MTLRVSRAKPFRTVASASATVFPLHFETRCLAFAFRGSFPEICNRSSSLNGLLLAAATWWDVFSTPLGRRWFFSKICAARKSFITVHSSRRGAPQTGTARIAAIAFSLKPTLMKRSFKSFRKHASECLIRCSLGKTQRSCSCIMICVGGKAWRWPMSCIRLTKTVSSGLMPSALTFSHSSKHVRSQRTSLASSAISSESRAPKKCNFANRSKITASACSSRSSMELTYKRLTGGFSGYFATNARKRSIAVTRFTASLWFLSLHRSMRSARCVRFSCIAAHSSSSGVNQGSQAFSSSTTYDSRPDGPKQRPRYSRSHLATSLRSSFKFSGNRSGNAAAKRSILSTSCACHINNMSDAHAVDKPYNLAMASGCKAPCRN